MAFSLPLHLAEHLHNFFRHFIDVFVVHLDKGAMNRRLLLFLFVLGFFRHRSHMIFYRMRQSIALLPEAPCQQLR
jgi:hypothetical protein